MITGRFLVTGGAGFIGSHLTERLLNGGHEVIVIDNFASGRIENIKHLKDNPSLTLIKEDLKNAPSLADSVQRCDVIFHLAANPEVRVGETSPQIHFEENVLLTFRLLESIRSVKEGKIIVFASTSTIYGDASQVPTPEEYGPLEPISTYGASKLACEAFVASYANTFDHRALLLRLANVTGPRSNHGVIVDFIKKISMNSRQLEILGDGAQNKSYLYITDCIDAIIHLTDRFASNSNHVDIFNVGSEDQITVKEIAKIVAQKMGNPDIRYIFAGRVDGGRGWRGDVKNMRLSIDKLLKTGWKPRYSSRETVELAATALLAEQAITQKINIDG